MTIRFPTATAVFNCTLPILACFLSLYCQREKPLDFWLQSEHEARLQLNFAGFDLSGQGILAGEAPLSYSDLWGSSRPFFERDRDLLCIQSHRPYFFAREMGMRFRFCSADFSTVDYNALVDSFSALKDPYYATDRLQLSRTSYRKLARSLKNVRVVLSGNPEENQAMNEKLSGQLNFYSAFPLNDQTLDYNPIPWTFENQSFDVIVTDSSVMFLYPEGGDLLLLSVQDPELARAFAAGLERLPPILRTVIKEATPSELFLSEYSTREGFIELAAPNQAAWQRARIELYSPTGYTFREDRFFFAGGVHVYRNMPVAGLELRQKGSYIVPELTEHEDRSMERSSAEGDYSPSIRCTEGRCHTEGMLILPVAPDPSFCSLDDLQLSEVNATGILTEHTLDPTGKFIEIAALRACRPDALVMEFDGMPLNLGENFREREIRLFSAGQAYFQQPFKADGRLRSIRPGSRLRLVDLGQHMDRSYELPQGTYLFADVAPASLVLGPDGFFFHPPGQTSIRPDLLTHHMSPGQANPALAVHPQAVILTEVMPWSLKDPAGVSRAEEEYIEVFINGNSDQLYSLAVESQGKIDHYPISPGSARGFIVFAKSKEPACLPQTREAQLSLPDSGEIRLSRGAAVLSALNWQQSQEQRSLEWVRGSLFTDSSAAVGPCPANRGTPGRPAEYDPFVHEQNGLILESSTPLQLTARYSGRTLESLTFQASPGLLSPPLASLSGQLFLDILHEDRQLYRTEVFNPAPELLIQTIVPVPAQNEEEWLRVCAVSDFRAERLFLRDSSAEDEIVPWFTRRTTPAPAGLSGSQFHISAGECAIVMDPDYNGHPLPIRAQDRALWTIQSTTALGNGISSGEAILIFAENRNLAAYGQDGGLHSVSGEFVERTHGTGSARSFFEVRR